MDKFEEIRNQGRLLYEYVRGSHLYGLATPQSDIDTGGVFTCTRRELLGSVPGEEASRYGRGYEPQISDAKSDNVWYELSEYVRLLCKSNPNMLESLYVPDELVRYRHECLEPLFANKDMFITRKCFASLFGYATAQISKARGLNKKITNPITERKTPLDFCYVVRGNGSVPLKQVLEENGMKHEYVGLCAIDHMHETYNAYYDYGRHIDEHGEFVKKTRTSSGELEALVTSYPTRGYRGIMDPEMKGNELRLSSIPKEEVPFCSFQYNASGYSKHCQEYKAYKEWEKNRNPIRYQSNLDKNYDSKNMAHCFRLVHMGIEIAEGNGMIVNRDGIDKDFLMDIRNHKYEYDELIEMLESEKERMDKAVKNTTVPETIDADAVNDMLIEMRTKLFNF